MLGGGLAGLTAATTAALAGATFRLLVAHPLGVRARTTTDGWVAVLDGGTRALYLAAAVERVDLGLRHVHARREDVGVERVHQALR